MLGISRLFERIPIVNGLATSSSSGLIARLKAADAEAWRRMVELYGPLIYRWARQFGTGPDDAADVVQETFRAVLTGVADLRHDRPGDSFRGWLWTITRSKVHDLFRSRRGLPEARGGTTAQQAAMQIPEPADEPSTGLSEADSCSLLQRSLELIRAEFEERTWRAFLLVAVEGRSPADVAEELGMTVQAVYQAKYRVLKRVREELS